MKQTKGVHGAALLAMGVGVLSAMSLASTSAAQTAEDAEGPAQEAWREAITQSEAPEEGCFHASYPSVAWNKIECVEAPNIQYRPRTGRISRTVGNGTDDVAEVSTGVISKTVGSFPKVTGVKSEKGGGLPNTYSLQLNSNFMNTPACDGASVPASCLDWLQYVYSSSSAAAFMQYWLIAWNTTCPKRWISDGVGDCYTNSAAVGVPQEPISTLKTIKISGSAKAGGLDKLIMTVGTQAYSTSGKDSVVDLATAWSESEFNIFGDGGGSEAKFNTGSSIQVKIAVTNGTSNAPTCAAGAGTTGETNNLNLGSCSATGGAAPHIIFTESN